MMSSTSRRIFLLQVMVGSFLFMNCSGCCWWSLGMMSLSIGYVIPTYMMLALSVSYSQMARRSALVAPPTLRFDVSLFGRMFGVGVGMLALIYVFVRFLA